MLTLSRNNTVAGLLILLFVIAVIVLTVLSVRNWAERLAGPQDSPIVMDGGDSITRPANNPDVCPGDVLMWPLTITYAADGLLIVVTRNVRNTVTGGLVAVDGRIYAEEFKVPQEEGGTFVRTAFWRVIDLPPSKYKLITSSQSATGGRLLQYYVEFNIKANCP